MAYQDNSTSYAFGQMGSILHEGGGSILDSGVTVAGELFDRGAVFVALTFLEDSVFESSNASGLVAEDNTLYPNSTSGSTAIDTNGGSTTDGITFPAGLTIYGRWTTLDLASGKLIAYIGY